MSVFYSIVPIDKEHTQGFNRFLSTFGVEIPSGTVSRYPTPSEIRQVLDEMHEFTKHYSVTEKVWDVDIYETAAYDPILRRMNGKRATIYSMGPALNESLPLPIYFHGGWEEVNLEITLRLTRFTGPLLLIGDFDAVPLLVSPGINLPELLNQWEKQREMAYSSQRTDDTPDTTPTS